MNNKLPFVSSLLLLILLVSCKTDNKTVSEPETGATPVKTWKPDDKRDIPGLKAKRGLVKKTDGATPGYILFHPSMGTSTYLMNLDGEIVHTWKCEFNSMNSELLSNGNLIRLERDPDFPVFAAGGQAGRIREYTWEGEMVWDFEYATANHLLHHDIEVMPNGNILAISYEVKSPEECRAAGRKPDGIPEAGLWPDKVIEIEPTRPVGGKIVWEWHMWDHLVQDHDPKLANYGQLSENPRKIDINFYYPQRPVTQEEIDQMIADGNSTSNATVANQGSDMAHCNAIHYNAELNQIALSSPHYSEIYIIDHSTTTEEAKGSTGGRWGHGGDLLYRWGNPDIYDRGTEADRQLFDQHDVRWIPKGMPGAGNLLIFNNEVYGPKGKHRSAFAAMGANQGPFVPLSECDNYSSVVEITPPVNRAGAYLLRENEPFGPAKPSWTYTAPDTFSFYAPFISSAHRLKNGNTFVNSGPVGSFMEVTADGKTVWEYWNPFFDDYKLPDGTRPQPVGPFMFAQFRATHLPADHPGLANRTLAAVDPQPKPHIPKPPAQ